jgi:hypothetical protein
METQFCRVQCRLEVRNGARDKIDISIACDFILDFIDIFQ